jgi:aminoglycoside phosphotransferase family enzyme/predicted kinase
MNDWHIEDYLDAIRLAHQDEPVDSIRWIETHISWICLTKEIVYKIKKPLKNAFLDYSTLELREHYCREEIRLDSRYAPSLYLNVLPFTLCNGALQLGGVGVPVEYCVQMKRFPSGALLSERLSQGACSANDLVQLANHIANFHQSAAIAPASSRFGAQETLLQESLDNFAALLGDPTLDVGTQETLNQLEAWTRSMHADCVAAFESRRANGFVRECHGDLHAGNVVWWDDELIPFDGIEFSDSFRWIDVLSDIAFALMDLNHLGYPGFSSVLLSTYLERTGDYAALKLLRWYIVYRALVRAKVSWLTMVQSSEQKQLAAGQARFDEASIERDRFIELALNQSRSRGARLWITFGLSGSGKSTGAMRIVEQYGALRIRADVERKRLFGLRAEDRPSDQAAVELYSAASSERTYEKLLGIASSALDAGHSVIVDATFLKRKHRNQFSELARLHQVPFTILHFEAPHDMLQRRLEQRSLEGRDASDATIEILKQQIESCEDLDESEMPFCVAFTS